MAGGIEDVVDGGTAKSVLDRACALPSNEYGKGDLGEPEIFLIPPNLGLSSASCDDFRTPLQAALDTLRVGDPDTGPPTVRPKPEVPMAAGRGRFLRAARPIALSDVEM